AAQQKASKLYTSVNIDQEIMDFLNNRSQNQNNEQDQNNQNNEQNHEQNFIEKRKPRYFKVENNKHLIIKGKTYEFSNIYGRAIKSFWPSEFEISIDLP
ncbi:8200_t:CDS:2, partial [Scutellospora calospora]